MTWHQDSSSTDESRPIAKGLTSKMGELLSKTCQIRNRLYWVRGILTRIVRFPFAEIGVKTSTIPSTLSADALPLMGRSLRHHRAQPPPSWPATRAKASTTTRRSRVLARSCRASRRADTTWSRSAPCPSHPVCGARPGNGPGGPSYVEGKSDRRLPSLRWAGAGLSAGSGFVGTTRDRFDGDPAMSTAAQAHADVIAQVL